MVVADRVVVELEARTGQYERNLKGADRAITRTAAVTRRASSNIASSLRGAFAAYAGVEGIRAATALIDANTRIANSLRVAGLEGQDLKNVYDQLFASAQRNAAPIESLAQLYGRVAIVQNELGVSTEELLGLTDNVAMALRVAGTDAASASGALLQLSQAFGSGVVRAEEFNSILEGALPIAQAAAAGLEEAGGSVARLRQLVVEGRVSSEAFFRAIEAGSHILEDRLGGAELTVSQAFVRLQNVLIDVAGEFNEGTNVSAALAGELETLGLVIQDLAGFAQAAVASIQTFVGWLSEGQAAATGFANELARLTGFERLGFAAAQGVNNLGIPGLTAGSSAAGRVVSGTFDLIGATPQDDALARILTGEDTPPPTQITVNGPGRTVSLDDYAVPNAPGAGSGRTGGGGSSPQQRFQEALEAQRRQIEMLREETAVRAGLNPLINDYGYALERLKIQQDLENEATRAGLVLTPERVDAIAMLADEYARASVEAARLEEQQQGLKDTVEEWAGIMQQATRGFIDDLLEGKDAAEAFGNVLRNIGNQLINMGLSSLFSPVGLGGLFGGFRANGGPVSSGRSYIVGERGPELFTPSSGGRIIANHDLGGGGANVTFAPQIDARGADVAAVARLEGALIRMQAELVPQIKSVVRGANRNWRVK